MKIAQIADRLRALSLEHDLPELATLANGLRRRKARGRAAATSEAMTPELAERIRWIKRNEPDLSQTAIGRMVNVNQGRVSEVLNGKRS